MVRVDAQEIEWLHFVHQSFYALYMESRTNTDVHSIETMRDAKQALDLLYDKIGYDDVTIKD